MNNINTNNNSRDIMYNEILFTIIANIIVLLFTIIFGIFVILSPSTNMIIKLLTIIVVTCALVLAINRDTYMPFLGKTVIPSSIITDKTPQGANVDYTILLNNVKDGTKVIYWGANSTDKNIVKTNPVEAYNNYVNAGVSTVSNGKAKITFFCPDKYQVNHIGIKNIIKRHIHYRLQCPETGILSSVLTIYVEC